MNDLYLEFLRHIIGSFILCVKKKSNNILWLNSPNWDRRIRGCGGQKVCQEIVMPISSLGDGIARENWPIESGET